MQQPPESLCHTTIWNFAQCDPSYGAKYPGRMPGQVVENLLWYYTEPFDIVLDPMAGGGTTLDVCKSMYRRCKAYDINPNEVKGIERNDITQGIPKLAIKGKPKLIVLDPPYASQKQGEYAKADSDLSNLSVDAFMESMGFIAEQCAVNLADDGKVALVISALRDKGKVFDLGIMCADVFREKGFEIAERIVVPNQNAESLTAEQIEYAIMNKLIIQDCRDLIIFKVA